MGRAITVPDTVEMIVGEQLNFSVDFTNLVAAGDVLSVGYKGVVLADSPLAYWRLGELSGSTAFDSGPGGKDSTIQLGVTKGEAGAIQSDTDTSMRFDSIAARIVTPSISANLSTGAISFEAWVKVVPDVRTHITTGAYEQIPTRFAPGFAPTLTLYNIIGIFPNVGITLRDNGTTFSAQGWLNGIASNYGVVLYDNWTHVVVVYTGFGSSSRDIYVNGDLAGTDTGGTTADFTNTMRVAEDPRWTAYDTTPDGFIDEVAVYNYALSAARILEHYNAGITSIDTISTSFVNAATRETAQFAIVGAPFITNGAIMNITVSSTYLRPKTNYLLTLNCTATGGTTGKKVSAKLLFKVIY